MIPVYLKPDGSEGSALRIRVSPGAKRNSVDGVHGESLRIRIAAPPVDGKANKALISFLSDLLSTPKRNLAIKSGEKGREKVVTIASLNTEEVAERLFR